MTSATRIRLAWWLDAMAVILLISGVLIMVQPWWKAGFQSGFWLTLAGIVATNITGRLAQGER